MRIWPPSSVKISVPSSNRITLLTADDDDDAMVEDDDARIEALGDALGDADAEGDTDELETLLVTSVIVAQSWAGGFAQHGGETLAADWLGLLLAIPGAVELLGDGAALGVVLAVGETLALTLDGVGAAELERADVEELLPGGGEQQARPIMKSGRDPNAPS